MIKTILFDLDGTLTASGEGIINGLRYSILSNGLDDSNVNYESFIGPPLLDSFKRELPNIDDKMVAKLLEDFRVYYDSKGKFENRVYDGIIETLNNLNRIGYTLMVATAKPKMFANQILEHFEIDKFFSKVYGATIDEKLTEKEQIIELLLKNEKLKLDETIMVGDRKHDILGAHLNGIKCIAVLFGYGNEKEFIESKADYIIEKPQKIIDIVKNI